MTLSLLITSLLLSTAVISDAYVSPTRVQVPLLGSRITVNNNDATGLKYKRQTMALRGVFDDDLPNILGINPIEATLLFGALYYFYGPNVLYEYAREAGKVFSTYAPIVKSVSTDIFNEFRDFLEEDRERESLRKSGLNIDNIPRRTSNIIQRFQDTFKAFDDVTKSTQGGIGISDEELDDEDDDDESSAVVVGKGGSIQSSGDADNSAQSKRRSKREMLKARKLELQLKEQQQSDGDGEANTDVVDSMESSAVLDRIGARTSLLASSNIDIDDFDQYVGPYGLPIERPSTAPPLPSAAAAVDPDILASVSAGGLGAAIGMSRFQQQMSGEWNQRVLRREPTVGGDGFVLPDVPEEWQDSSTPAFAAEPPSLTASESEPGLSRFQMQLSGQWNQQIIQDSVPIELSMGEPHSVMGPGGVDMGVEAVLEEIDRDYAKLRSKLVALLEAQRSKAAEANTVLKVSAASRRTYWPPSSQEQSR